MAIFPSLLVGAPLELRSAHLLVFLAVVPPSELGGGLPWSLYWGPPSDLAAALDLVMTLVPPLELWRRAWRKYWKGGGERRPSQRMLAAQDLPVWGGANNR